MLAVETNGLTKHYGRVEALKSCDLKVESGKVFGLLGPNGAGKTTLVKLLLGIIHPTSGTAQIMHQSISDYRMHRHIGYLAENHRFPDFLSARQVLFYYGRMAGVSTNVLEKRIPELLEMVGLKDWINIKIHKFSKGMMQRLGLAHAMINDPDILFLDEPTDGIDPVGRREIRDVLKHLRDSGKTIFLNSHLLSEVERLSDEIAILKNGRILENGPLANFISVHDQYLLDVDRAQTGVQEICSGLKISAQQSGTQLQIAVRDDAQLNELIDKLRAQKIIIKGITPRKISLEDFFIEVLQDGRGGQA